MPSSRFPVFAREDTFFGVCQALGDDFGFGANWLRVALGVLLIWNPLLALAAYGGAGMVVAMSRLLVPEPGPAVSAGPEPACAPRAGNDDDASAEALADAA